MQILRGCALTAGLLAVGLWWTAAAAQAPEELPAPKAAEVKGAQPTLSPTILDLCQNADAIDLTSALRLAGVQNPEMQLARTRVLEAVALRQLAAAQFLPNINAGTNFNSHLGNLQRAGGDILRVNRSALYAGLGAGAVGAGTVTIPGIAWHDNVSRVYFNLLINRQNVQAREFRSAAVDNQVLLRVASAYLELLRAQGRRAIALRVRTDAAEVARVTENFARTGQGRQADADRAATELEQRNSDVTEAEGNLLVASARLAQLLDLDPSCRLMAVDSCVIPAPLVPEVIPLCELLAIAVTQRPELAERQTDILMAMLQLRAAKLLPFSPNLLVGYSTGTFGGGSNLAAEGILQPDGSVLQQPRFGSFAGRQDLDVVLYWSARNFGVGNLAQVRWSQANLRASHWRMIETLNRVRAEVASAQARILARFAQLEINERAVASSTKAFQEDFQRTRNREGLPIEVLDSLRLLGRSSYAYLDSIVDYNRAQFEMYVALGQPPADCLARPLPPGMAPPVMPTADCPPRPLCGPEFPCAKVE